MTVLVVPSSAGPVTTLLQLDDAMPLVFCCNVKSVAAKGQERASVLLT